MISIRTRRSPNPPLAPALSEYLPMWLFVMFDLPVDDKQKRKQYAQFRKALLREGFCMLQYSVYARYCITEEASNAHRGRIRGQLPPHGQVRVLNVTDRQFGKMEVYFGKSRHPVEDPPAQLMLF